MEILICTNQFYKLQTNSFVFDPLWSEYLDGSQNDPLIKIAKKTNEFLKINPYKDLTKDDWNNIIFKKYYEFEKKVNFYRGVIWICGSEATKNKIKKAWKEKDWNTFRNFGIVSGGEKEAGSWKLPANLLKKHFTKNENQPFRTLEQDKLYNPGKYKVNTWYTARDLGFGEYQNFHIAFEDEGAFAWTNKWPKDKENNEYFQAQGLEILTVTNPLKYDIGIFRKNFSYDLALLVSEAFGIVAQNKKDTIGPSLGYNGYEVITKDRANKEVVQLYKKFISTK